MPDKIANAGIYDIPMSIYHGDCCAGPSISSSGLRTIFNESPAHYWVTSYLNPDRIEQEETEAFALGRAAHHLLLGEADFSTLFIARPESLAGKPWQGNRLECRAWMAEQQAQGRTVLKGEQINQIRGMARSLAANPLIAQGALNGMIEKSIVWRDEDTGIFLKARPDATPNDSGDFCDLKTCNSVSDDALRKSIADFSYHQQAALVADGWQIVTGNSFSSFSLVFVEKSPPFCCRIVTLKECDLARGAKQNRIALRMFGNCLKAGAWPGPGGADAEYIELPTWAQTRIDSKLQFMGAA